MKKVCIIRSNPVKPDSRVEKLALSLNNAGYQVHILAWDRDSNHKARNEDITIRGIKIPITRLGFKATFGEGMKNIFPFLNFQVGIRMYLRKNQFDFVHACDFDTAFFTYKMIKHKKEKFIFDIFDFLASEPQNLFQSIVKKAQIRIINSADATIICSEGRKKQIEGSKPRRLSVIHNTPMRILANDEDTVINREKNNTIKVSYIGILQDFRLLEEIPYFFINNQQVELHVGGFGLLEDYYISLSKKYKNIIFYGRIPYERTIEVENYCDINLAIYDPNIDNHKYAAPNKFYESLMLGKPIIMAEGTGMSEIVYENDIGVLIDYSRSGFEIGMEQLISRKLEWPKMSARMKQLYRQRYNWDIMDNRLRELYDNIYEQNRNSLL